MPAAPLLLLLALALAGCEARDAAAPPTSAAPKTPADTSGPPPSAAAAAAEIEPVGRSGVRGTVTATQVEGGVRVAARLDGLSETGFHAFQVLASDDCDDPRHLGDSAGAPHGGPYGPPGFRHAGDLGNVRGDDGEGRYDRIDPVLALDGPLSAVGRAVVVRALPDDASSPDGAAGDVIGCGVLQPAP